MKNIITIGGGIAGIEASNILSGLGYNVTIIEKEKQIGGKVKNWYHLFPDFTPSSDITNYLNSKLEKNKVTIENNTKISQVSYQNSKWQLVSDKSKIFNADAILIASGYELFNASRKEEYGYNIYDNVITSADLEEKFNKNQKIKTVNGESPKRIGIVHCVGSRDEKSGNHYCSKVCCITGTKQAIELAKLMPDSQIFCFYMDLRMYDKHFEELYRTAQEHHNIQYIRGRVSEVSENEENKLILKTEDTLSGRPLKMKLDMLVLLVGMEAGRGTAEIGKTCNLSFEESGFLKSKNLHTKQNLSSKEGIFLAGTCIAPMSVKETLDNARSSAFEIHNYLSNN